MTTTMIVFAISTIVLNLISIGAMDNEPNRSIGANVLGILLSLVAIGICVGKYLA